MGRVIQVQNPKHANFYKTLYNIFGIPYGEVDKFVDYCGIPASVLSWTVKFNFNDFKKTVERIFAPDIYSIAEKTTAKDIHSATRKHAC